MKLFGCLGLVELPKTILPLHKNHRKPFIKDKVLNSLCHQNCGARASWITDGCPHVGQSYGSMKSARKRMKSYLTCCHAREECKILQSRDTLFRRGDSRRFKKPTGSSFNGSRVWEDNRLLTDPNDVLLSWEGYFSDLCRSRVSLLPWISHLDLWLLHLT